MTTEKRSKLNAVTHQFEPLSPAAMKDIGYNFTNHSSVIAQYIIEKLISYTITSHERNIIDQKIPNHCFEFFHRIFNNALQAEYIAYDRDDMNVEKVESLKPVFFDNKYSGYNDWSGLSEPKSSKIDRAASTYIKVIKSNIGYNVNEIINEKCTSK